MINLSSKFQVYTFTYYEYTKGNAKRKNLGGFGWPWLTQDHRKHNHSIKHIRLPIRL